MDITGKPDQLSEADLQLRADQRRWLLGVPDRALYATAVRVDDPVKADWLLEAELRRLAAQATNGLGPAAAALYKAHEDYEAARRLSSIAQSLRPKRQLEPAGAAIHLLRDEAEAAKLDAQSRYDDVDAEAAFAELARPIMLLIAADLASGDGYTDTRLRPPAPPTPRSVLEGSR